MVSRLLGKLDAQRQRMLGSAGACATACWTAAAPAAAAPPAMNLRRFMGELSSGWGSAILNEVSFRGMEVRIELQPGHVRAIVKGEFDPAAARGGIAKIIAAC